MSLIGTDGAALCGKLELPFRPFTADEVLMITGVSVKRLEHWVQFHLKIHAGCGAIGLEYMQTFAVFVANKFLEEGSGQSKADDVLRFVCCMTPDQMTKWFAQGLTFPFIGMKPNKKRYGVMVKNPGGPLGNRLDLKVLFAEFESRLFGVFDK